MPDLQDHVGRHLVYIEDQCVCIATLEDVHRTHERVGATFRIVADTFRCRLRMFCNPGDSPVEELLEEAPFGEAWEFESASDEFDVKEVNCWQVTFLWGGGIRMFFEKDFVSRTLRGDVMWIDEYYNQESDESD
jgi:hypothetical protein